MEHTSLPSTHSCRAHIPAQHHTPPQNIPLPNTHISALPMGNSAFLQHTQTLRSTNTSCMCPALKRDHPSLFCSEQTHAVLQTKQQWQVLFSPTEVRCGTQNARNASLPDHDFIEQCITRLHTARARFMNDEDDFVVLTDTILRTL